jgi:hypothetical protein
MKYALVLAAAIGITGSSLAFAQTSSSSNSQPATHPQSQTASPGSSSPATGQNGLVTRQKLAQDLQNAGFSDVKIVQEAFVVQAKTRDGNPIVMTIGPNGLSAFEAIANGPATTGSTGHSASAANGSPSATQKK